MTTRDAPDKGHPLVFDEAALAAIAEDPDLQAAMVAAFLRQLPSMAVALRQACAGGEGWRPGLHKLKGAGAAIGAARLVALLRAAEESDDDGAPSRQSFQARIDAEIAALEVRLRRHFT